MLNKEQVSEPSNQHINGYFLDMSPSEDVLYPFSVGFFEVTNQREDKLRVEHCKVYSRGCLKKNTPIVAIFALKPLYYGIIHSKDRLILYDLAIIGSIEPKNRSEPDYSHTEHDPNDT